MSAEAAAERGVEVVGRESEGAMLRDFLAAAGGSGALLLTGEAGIGKTTLWEAGVTEAREHGLRVLVARPSGAEAELFRGVDRSMRWHRDRGARGRAGTAA